MRCDAHALTDEQWERIQGLLDATRPGPKPKIGDRAFIDAVLFRAKTGIPWRDLPERFGPWKSGYNRFNNWAKAASARTADSRPAPRIHGGSRPTRICSRKKLIGDAGYDSNELIDATREVGMKPVICANPTMTSANGQSRSGTVYRYYRCYGQMKGPAADCEHPRVPAGEVEQLVIDKVREVCADPTVRGEVAKRLQWGKEQSGRAIALEREVIQKKIDELSKEAASLLTFVRESGGKVGSTVSDQLAKVELELDEQRLKANELDDRLRGLSAAVGRVQSALDLLSNFSEVWEVLVPEERCDLVKLLIERVKVNVPEGELHITLHDLTDELPPLPDIFPERAEATPAEAATAP